ncbi:hypothetical protein NW767_010452 [Fusarium falciforme]|nr:hypothetical protein NW767_010452 [Fusarium falciforme]
MAPKHLRRLQQTLSHLSVGARTSDAPQETQLSIVRGPNEPPLSSETLGTLLERQVKAFGDRCAVRCSWTGQQLTYKELHSRSRALAAGLLSLGLTRGDHIAIMAGNCEQYVEVIFAAGLVGLPLVVLNTNYTNDEVENAVHRAECRLLFTTPFIGSRNMAPTIESMRAKHLSSSTNPLTFVLLERSDSKGTDGAISYESLVLQGLDVSPKELDRAEKAVQADDVCSLQFTSGTTGKPKVAMLTHSGLINNCIGSGHRLKLTEKDVLCCVVPLFHCFGLVLGVLMSVAHGSLLVFPSENFSPVRALQSMTHDKCTLIYGVPTMHTAYIQEVLSQPPGTYDLSSVRIAITGGAATPMKLFKEIREILQVPHIIQAFGMTECSPVTFLTTVEDSFETCSTTVGKVMPHVTAKVVDTDGKTVPLGQRGEILIAGYNSFRGYWKNPQGTEEMLHKEEDGTVWLRTGDEVTLDKDGFCRVTGRIKDIIIRGGENIYPAEIEDCLVQHPSIIQASVVGIKDARYGEVVAAFVQQEEGSGPGRPSTSELQTWVGKTLARHKIPAYIWWIGDKDVCKTLPQTASGKVRKVALRDTGSRLIGA